jgi:hypothetical protein
VKRLLLMTLVLLCVGGLRSSASAQEGAVVVTIPFEFVAATTTLPAGTYTVSRTSSLTSSPLLIFNHENGVFLPATAFDERQSHNTGLSFDLIGDKHVLSKVKTFLGTYTIDSRREAERLTKMDQSNEGGRATSMSPSGTQ